MPTQTRRRSVHRFTPSQIIALGFLIIILLGTALLMLPFASRGGQGAPFLDALFTATSATCVTGLVVRDTATGWSVFGQGVLLALIQIGGMGFVTIVLLFKMLRGKRIGLGQRFLMQESAGLPQMGGILRTTGFLFEVTIFCELGGALALATRFVPRFGWVQGLWRALFHSVSAFCNAGFDIMGTEEAPFASVTAFVGDAVVNATLMLLIIIGGLGFLVWADLYEKHLRWKRLRLQSKLVLTTTAILLVLSAAFMWAYEFRLPTWAGYTPWERFWAALFSAVSPRTAGFNTVDYALFSGPGQLMVIVLMLIGGSPGSTAGGLKTTTVAALLLEVWTTLRRKRDVEAFGRRFSHDTLRRCAVLLTMYLVLFLCGGTAISMLEAVPIGTALFEAASALGTVGLSQGLTPTLGTASRWILIFLMYLGRVGGLTLIFALADPNAMVPGRLPEADIIVG